MSLSGMWYHGSPFLFSRFSAPRRYSPTEQLGFGIHFARKIEFAKLYGDVIYRCRLNPVKVLNVVQGKCIAPGSKMDAFAKEFFPRGHHPYFIDKDHYVFGDGTIDLRSPKQSEIILKKWGYDAVVYRARYGSRTLSGGRFGMNVQSETVAVTILDSSKIEIVDRKVLKQKKT